MIEEYKNEICVSKEVLDFLTGIHADRENIEQRKVEMTGLLTWHIRICQLTQSHIKQL